jgi:hypothetical protein
MAGQQPPSWQAWGQYLPMHTYVHVWSRAIILRAKQPKTLGFLQPHVPLAWLGKT